MTRSRSSLAAVLFGLSAVLMGVAWWFLRSSHCAGDLKQGFGDIESALGFEGQALITFSISALLLAFGISVARPIPSNWVQLGVWLAFIPVTYGAFVGLSLFAGGAWPCAQ